MNIKGYELLICSQVRNAVSRTHVSALFAQYVTRDKRIRFSGSGCFCVRSFRKRVTEEGGQSIVPSPTANRRLHGPEVGI